MDQAMDTVMKAERKIILAFFARYETAEKALQDIIDQDFPMDRISLLGKASTSGDDPLGVYYPEVGERMKGWGKQGALWGGLWGMLAGAAGIFMLPGSGPVLAAGPVVQAIIGATGGAGIAGGVLAGAAAASQLSVAMHRMGVPGEAIDRVETLINEGYHMLSLITDSSDADTWRSRLESSQADEIISHPYVGIVEAVRETV